MGSQYGTCPTSRVHRPNGHGVTVGIVGRFEAGIGSAPQETAIESTRRALTIAPESVARKFTP
jgi:hypothetical protein